jgi:hypothetical protein
VKLPGWCHGCVIGGRGLLAVMALYVVLGLLVLGVWGQQ